MNSQAGDPWYVHVLLYVVIAVLTILLIKVAIIDPKEIVAIEKYNRTESRLRMTNIKEAEILWESPNHARPKSEIDAYASRRASWRAVVSSSRATANTSSHSACGRAGSLEMRRHVHRSFRREKACYRRPG